MQEALVHEAKSRVASSSGNAGMLMVQFDQLMQQMHAIQKEMQALPDIPLRAKLKYQNLSKKSKIV